MVFIDNTPAPYCRTSRLCVTVEFVAHTSQIHCAFIRSSSTQNRGIILKKIAIIRSGGQTGADRGGLDAALKFEVPIAGWCPKNGLAEDCPTAPGVRALYPALVDTPSAGYEQRTGWNVRDAHATLIVAPLGVIPQSGTEMTVDFAHEYGRPVLVVDGISEEQKIFDWLEGLGYGLTLNIAGPRESKCPGVHNITQVVVERLLEADRD